MAKGSGSTPSADGTAVARSETTGPSTEQQPTPDVTAASASQKRGRGRPPKSQSDSQPKAAVSARKPSARPKRTAAATSAPAASVAATVKSNRGRPKRSTAAVAPATGSRKRGRPKGDDVAAAPVAPAKKRGRKPKVAQVAKKTLGRTRKASTTTGQEAANPGELKKKTALLQKKVKEAADKLKLAVKAIEEVHSLAAGM